MKLKATLIGITLFFAVFAMLYSPTLGKNRSIFDIFNFNTYQNQESDNSVSSNIIADSQVSSKNNEDQNNSENSSDLSEDSATVAGEKDVLDQENNQNFVLVTKVTDGDTIEIEGGQKVRYIGIDTPETVHPSKPVMCFGKEASNYNKDLVFGQKIRLEKDISETDKYGRLLRYVYLEDGTFVNLQLVKEGYATSYSYPPDIKFQQDFLSAEKLARDEGIGLWGECESSESPENECNIKGNISASGEKIYHMPEQYYYSKTLINESNGERWFCSEQEAKDAGWRKSLK